MLFLALAVGCSLAIGMIFKYTGRERMDRITLLTVNYAAAVATAGVLLAFGGRTASTGLTWSPSLLGLAIGTGALLIAGFFVLMLATDVAGMSLAIGVMRVSVVIPFLASWIVWSETPTIAQGAGMLVAAASFFLIAHRPSEPLPVLAGSTDPPEVPVSETVSHEGPQDTPSASASTSSLKVFGVLALTFLSGGAVDVSMKTFQEGFGAANSRVLFLLLAFGVSFVIGAVIVLVRGLRSGDWPETRTVAWGLGLGVINYGSLEFILRAIERLPGTFVFPANNIAVVVLAAVLGVTVWKETLTRPNRIGLGMAVVALLLLNF